MVVPVEVLKFVRVTSWPEVDTVGDEEIDAPVIVTDSEAYRMSSVGTVTTK